MRRDNSILYSDETRLGGGSVLPAEERPYLVRAADGHEVEGWAIRRDTLVVLETGLRLPLTAVIDGRDVEVLAAHGAQRALAGRMTALELPVGSLELDGDFVPRAVKMRLAAERIAMPSARRPPIWCYVFPRLRGCPRPLP